MIETPEFKDVLSFNTMILAGPGRENEKGRTWAHYPLNVSEVTIGNVQDMFAVGKLLR